MIDPRYSTVEQWADAVVLALSSYGAIPKLAAESKWKAWAQAIVMLPGIAVFAPPDPRSFSHWRSWAERFSQLVPL